MIVKGLRVTPFGYNIDMMKDVMTKEKSYDSLPNFAAADCKCSSTVFSAQTELYVPVKTLYACCVIHVHFSQVYDFLALAETNTLI